MAKIWDANEIIIKPKEPRKIHKRLKHTANVGDSLGNGISRFDIITKKEIIVTTSNYNFKDYFFTNDTIIDFDPYGKLFSELDIDDNTVSLQFHINYGFCNTINYKTENKFDYKLTNMTPRYLIDGEILSVHEVEKSEALKLLYYMLIMERNASQKYDIHGNHSEYFYRPNAGLVKLKNNDIVVKKMENPYTFKV